MTRRRRDSPLERISTRGFLLRRVDFGDADLVVTLFTEQLGRISAVARGARRSQKRFGGSLEPIHTLSLELGERAGAELLALETAQLEHPRLRLTRDLAALDAAGRALRWIRKCSPARTPEPALWSALSKLLDQLDSQGRRPPCLLLAEFGLALLPAVGWGLDFERCVRCGRPCPEGQPAPLDPARGGLVCRRCGGARLKIDSELRERLARAARGTHPALEPEDESEALLIVEQALKAHADVD